MNSLLIALVSAALYYLGSRAELTRALWSRYPTKFASFADCSACTGFWWGAGLAATVGYWNHFTYLGLDLREPWSWPLVGLASIVTTPIVAGLMQRGIDALGVIAPSRAESPHAMTRLSDEQLEGMSRWMEEPDLPAFAKYCGPLAASELRERREQDIQTPGSSE